MTIGGEERMGGGERFDVVQPHNHAPRSARSPAPPAGRAGRRRRGAGRRPRLARDVLRRPRRDHPARRRAAGRPVARDDRRLDHARPVQDRPAGRDRRPCELVDFWRFNVHYARQILAEQPVANSPACGTGSTTARWRASSTRSRRSTSRPSPATCPPRPR